MPDVKSNRYLALIRWFLLAAAYTYLAWKLWRFKEYDTLFSILNAADWRSYTALAVALILMPLNLLTEAVRWRLLLSHLIPLNLTESIRQVTGGLTGAFLTPFRTGEIPARLAYLQSGQVWKQALAAGLYGGVLMTLVITVIGIVPALSLLSAEQTSDVWLFALGTIALCTGGIAAMHKVASRYDTWKCLHIPLLKTTLWTATRYLCFTLQFALMLYAVGIRLQPMEMMTAIPAYYLLVTLTPNMPAADAGIRGGWAVFVFSRFTDNYPLAAAAAIGMWIINTILPFCSLILPKWQKKVCGTTIDK